MPARFNLYSAWIDPKFYGWAALFAAALLLLIYAMRRYRDLGRAAAHTCDEPVHGPEAESNPFLEGSPARPAPYAAEAGQEEKTLVLAPGEQLAFLAAAADAGTDPAPQQEAEAAAPAVEPPPAEAPVPEPEPEPAPAPAAAPGHAAETFVRGIYAGINDLDERMKTIEAALSKGHVNTDFTVKFLEDMVQDMDNLDKSKIKARIEYLLSDLKK